MDWFLGENALDVYGVIVMTQRYCFHINATAAIEGENNNKTADRIIPQEHYSMKHQTVYQEITFSVEKRNYSCKHL